MTKTVKVVCVPGSGVQIMVNYDCENLLRLAFNPSMSDINDK